MRNFDPINSVLPCNIVVIRHGRREDTGNPLWQIQARFPFDTPLTEFEDEISAAAQRLKEACRTFDVVYTSPFLRCLETSERLLRSLGCERTPVFIHKRLSEVQNPKLLFKTTYPSLSQRARYWLWQSTYRRHSRPVRQRFATKARILDSNWPRVPESELCATLRFRQVILELAAKHPGQQVLIVSHGKSVQVAYEALGLPKHIQQVNFAGFVSCSMQPQQQQHPRQQPEGQGAWQARDAAQWSDFGLDPAVPYFNLAFYMDADE